jgi:hypothetical protein
MTDLSAQRTTHIDGITFKLSNFREANGSVVYDYRMV